MDSPRYFQTLICHRKISKGRKWVTHELSDGKMEKRRAFCEIMLLRQERKSLLYQIVTGDKK